MKKKNQKTFEVNIAEEFDKVNTSIQTLSNKIDGYIHTFERQLTKLNANMENVLSTIADHEARISKLETTNTKATVKKDTIREIMQKGIHVLQWLAIGGFYLAAFGGVGWALKLLNIIK